LVREVFVVVTNASDSDPRKIAKPDCLNETLLFWLLHAHKGRDRHDTVARRYETYRLFLGSVATLFATLAGASVLGLVEKAWPLWGKLLVGGIGILAGFSAGLGTFLNLPERVDRHRSAGVRYKIAIRELERIIGSGSSACTPTDIKRIEMTDIERIEKQLNELEESAPVVSERIYEHVEKKWEKRGIKYVGKATDLYPPEQNRQ